MKRVYLFIVGCLLGLSSLAGSNETVASHVASNHTGSVYVIPITNQINDATLYIVRRGVKEAQQLDAAAIVFLLDTPGGRVDTTEEIVKNMLGLSVPTYAFVEYNAISAGGLIACATDKIYMRPGSKIGDAMPIMPGQELAEAEREKVEAYVAAFARTIAESKGRPPELIESMVRRDVGFEIDGEVICEVGRVLTLTNGEAEKTYGDPPRPLLSEGTVENLDELLEREGLVNHNQVHMEITWSEQLFVHIAAISPMLLGLGIMGLMLAMYNPGLATPAFIFSGCCFVVFFFGHHVAGLAGNEEVLIFIIGLILIGIEIFVIPGFGFAGIIGAACVFGSLLAAMVQTYPGEVPGVPQIPGLPAMSDLSWPITSLLLAIVISATLIAVVSRWVERSNVFSSWFVLREATATQSGYTSAKTEPDLMGQEGVALHDLHPGGSVQIGDRFVDVITEGMFVEAGARVRVVKSKGNRIVVAPID